MQGETVAPVALHDRPWLRRQRVDAAAVVEHLLVARYAIGNDAVAARKRDKAPPPAYRDGCVREVTHKVVRYGRVGRETNSYADTTVKFDRGLLDY